MNRKAVAVLLSGAGLLAAGETSAGPISCSLTDTQTAGAATQTLFFNQFDASLGTLLGVVFTISSEQSSLQSGIQGSFNSGEGGNASGNASASFDVTGPAAVPLFSGSVATSSSCVGVTGVNNGNCSGSHTSTVLPNFVALTASLTAPPTNLSAFIGTGQFGVLFSVSASASTAACHDSQGSTAICTPTATENWQGQFDVAYQFTPAVAGAIPEPASLALVGLGLAGLGWTRRRT